MVIADDGYVLANPSVETEVDEEQAAEVQLACKTGKWLSCKFTNCLGECTAGGCACTRSRNALARDGFLRTTVQQIAEAAKGRTEVSYASLGSGFLRFDFTVVEGLLTAGVPLSAVHVIDSQYDPDAKGHEQYRVALAQFAAWFANRGVDVYAHASVESFAFRVRQANALPVAILQIDCSELTWVFDSVVKPMLEDVLHYDGLFCSLTSREGAASVGASGANDAWGEVWRLIKETGRMRLAMKIRYRPGEKERILGEDEPLPPAVSH